MLEFLALFRQQRRCRKGDHAWETIFVGRKSTFCKCRFCPEVGYLLHNLKEIAPRG